MFWSIKYYELWIRFLSVFWKRKHFIRCNFLAILQISLGEALVSAGCQLVELDLSDNAFGPDGVRGFEALLKSPACFTLQELKLNNCGMGIGGGKVNDLSWVCL